MKLNVATAVLVAAYMPAPAVAQDCSSNPKCQGESACSGVADQSKIGCGSCNGRLACVDAKKDIGTNSCNGAFTCFRASGGLNLVDRNSCHLLKLTLTLDSLVSQSLLVMVLGELSSDFDK